MKNIQTTTTSIKELLKKLTAKKITMHNSMIQVVTVIVFSPLLFACQKESYKITMAEIPLSNG